LFKNLKFQSDFFDQKKAGSFQPHRLILSSLVVLLLLMPALLFSYNPVQAADGQPTLSIPTITVNVMNGTTVAVPISFADAADPNEISALSFSLDFDQTCLTFDSVTDTNVDGIPNAVTGLPNGYVSTVSYNATDATGEIDLSISDQVNPQAALSDGVLVTFTFGVESACRTDNGATPTAAFAFGLPSPTFGDVLGVAVVGGAHTNGSYSLRFNANPTDITPSATTVEENVALATTVATLSSLDPDSDLLQTHTYSLVSGAGSTDNGAFIIDGATLETNAALNFELKDAYLIRLRTTDNLGGTYEEAFTIDVDDVNETPTSLSINTSSVNENVAGGATVGTFSSVDPDAGATAAYSLVAGIGDTNNASFTIVSGVLQTAVVFNYEAKNAYNIRVQVTDGTFLFDNIFTIRVNDVNDAPVAVADVVDPELQVISVPNDLFVLANDTDQDIPHAFTVSAFTAPVSGTVINNTTSLNYTPAANFNGVVTFNYTVSDGQLTDNDAVTITVVTNDERGDCNSDGAVNAGDFPALVLENFDTDTVGDKWYEIYQTGYAGSPRGCDANVSKSVTISDLTCAVLVSFGNSVCTSSTPVLAASTLADAELAVGQNLIGVRSSTVNVPVRLTTNGQNVAAASFALSFDKDQLAFDTTDADQNGLPDAVTFNTPQGMVTVANYNADAHRLELTIYAVTMPMPKLADGLVANVTLQVNEQATLAATPVTLVQSSLGSDQGQAVPVAVSDGSVQIAQARFLFLPMISR